MIVYKGLRNCGQSCSAVNRVYANASIHDVLVAKLKVIADTMTYGDGITDPNVDLGPMATRDGVQVSREHVTDAVARGAVLITGGTQPSGGLRVFEAEARESGRGVIWAPRIRLSDFWS